MSWQFTIGLIVGHVLTLHGPFLWALLYLNPWLAAIPAAGFAVLFVLDVTKAIKKGGTQ